MCQSSGLTLEPGGRQRQDTRPGLANMDRVPPDRSGDQALALRVGEGSSVNGLCPCRCYRDIGEIQFEHRPVRISDEDLEELNLVDESRAQGQPHAIQASRRWDGQLRGSCRPVSSATKGRSLSLDVCQE